MKNKKWIIISIIIFIIIAVIISLILIFNNSENKEGNNKDYTEKELYTLIYKHKLMYFDMANNSFRVSELTNEEISEYIYNIYKDYFKNNNIDSFSASEVDNAIQSIFGDKIKYEHTNLHYNEKTKKYDILYDNDKKIYYSNGEYENSLNNNISFVTKTKLEKKNNKYILTLEKFFFIPENNKVIGIFGNYVDAINKKNILLDVSLLNISNERKAMLKSINEIVDKNYNKLTKKSTKYKYIFIYNNNNIYLDSYEIV